MVKMTVFHSGNPNWKSCQVAIGIAKAMKEKFGDKMELNIYKNDSEEAKAYTLLSSTSVFVNDQPVPREIALDKKGINDFLTEIISQQP